MDFRLSAGSRQAMRGNDSQVGTSQNSDLDSQSSYHQTAVVRDVPDICLEGSTAERMEPERGIFGILRSVIDNLDKVSLLRFY